MMVTFLIYNTSFMTYMRLTNATTKGHSLRNETANVYTHVRKYISFYTHMSLSQMLLNKINKKHNTVTYFL